MAQPILPVSAQAEINGLYVALYDVPATQAGFNFWLSALQKIDPTITSASASISTADAQALGIQMTANAPVVNGTTYFATLYPTTITDVSFVEALYQNTAGFQGTGPGIQFWTTQLAALEAGGETVTQAREAIAGNFVEAFLQNNLSLGAAFWGLSQSDFNALVTGQQALLNKVSVSEYWAVNSTADNGLLNYTAANLSPPSGPFAAGMTLINSVNANPGSQSTAQAAINSAISSNSLTPINNVPVQPQQSVALTTGTDVITAAANFNNVAITGVVDNAPTNNQTTAQVFDQINPGGTNNSITITTINTVPALSSSNLPTLNNVQSLFVTNAGTASLTTTLTGVGPALTTIGVTGGGTSEDFFNGFSGTQITNFSVTNQTQGALVVDIFSPNAGLTSGGAASGTATVNVSNDPATNGAGTVEIALRDTSATDGYATLTLNSTGSVANELLFFGVTNGATLKTLNITGTAAVKVDNTAIALGFEFAKTATIAASSDTGGFNINVTGMTAGSKVTLVGGSGVDTFTLSDSNFIASGTSLNGGTGKAGNTLTDTGWTNSAADYTALNATTGFQVFGLNGAAETVNAANITNGINSFLITTNIGDTISNLASGATVTVAVTGGPETATAAVGATTLNLAIGQSTSKGISVTKMTTTGFSTINLSSNGSVSNTVHFANSDNTNFVVTGSDGLTATISGVGSGDTWSGSAFTGKLALTGSAFGGDLISTGSGSSTINEQAGALPDSITYLSGHTKAVTLVSNEAINTVGQGFDKVANYVLGQDILNSTFGALAQATSADMTGIVTGTGLVVASTFSSSAQFITAAEATTTATAGHVAAWTDGTNTWVAEWFAAGAGHAHIVELVGVTGATSVSLTAATGTVTI